MGPAKIIEVNCSTGKTIMREPTPEEAVQYDKDVKDAAAAERARAEVDAGRETRRQKVVDLLAGIGLTPEDIQEHILNG